MLIKLAEGVYFGTSPSVIRKGEIPIGYRDHAQLQVATRFVAHGLRRYAADRAGTHHARSSARASVAAGAAVGTVGLQVMAAFGAERLRGHAADLTASIHADVARRTRGAADTAVGTIGRKVGAVPRASRVVARVTQAAAGREESAARDRAGTHRADQPRRADVAAGAAVGVVGRGAHAEVVTAKLSRRAYDRPIGRDVEGRGIGAEVHRNAQVARGIRTVQYGNAVAAAETRERHEQRCKDRYFPVIPRKQFSFLAMRRRNRGRVPGRGELAMQSPSSSCTNPREFTVQYADFPWFAPSRAPAHRAGAASLAAGAPMTAIQRSHCSSTFLRTRDGFRVCVFEGLRSSRGTPAKRAPGSLEPRTIALRGERPNDQCSR